MDLLQIVRDLKHKIIYVKLRNGDHCCKRISKPITKIIKDLDVVKCKRCNLPLIGFVELVGGEDVTYYHPDGKEFCDCISDLDIVDFEGSIEDGNLVDLI